MKKVFIFLLTTIFLVNSIIITKVNADNQKVKFSDIAFSSTKNIVEYKGNVYYINTNQSNKIYVYNPIDRTNKVAVNIDSCNNLTLYKGSLFFTIDKSVLTENDMKIYRYDIDKKGLKLIKLSNIKLDKIDEIAVYSDYLYFRIENMLYRISLNNYIPQLINKNVSRIYKFILYDGYIYFLQPNAKFKSSQFIYSGESLYRMNLKTLGIEPIMANLSVDNFDLYNNKLYFCGNLDNKPNSDILGYYNTANGKIVYKYITFKAYLPYNGNNNGFIFSDNFIYFWGKAAESWPGEHYASKVYKLNLSILDSSIDKIEKSNLEYVDIEKEEISCPSTVKWAIKNQKRIISIKDNKVIKYNLLMDSKYYIVDITDKYIYYIDNLGQIIKASLDQKEKYVIKQAKIVSPIEYASTKRYIFIHANVNNGAWFDEDFVFRIDKLNDSVKLFKPSSRQLNLVSINGQLYSYPWLGLGGKKEYFAINKIDENTFTETSIVESGCDSLFHVYNNYLYYFDSKNNLIRVKLDGSEKKIIDKFTIFSDYLEKRLDIKFYKDYFYFVKTAANQLFLFSKNLEKNSKLTYSVMEQGTDILGIDNNYIYMNDFIAGLDGSTANIILSYDKKTKKYKKLDSFYGELNIKPLKNLSSEFIYIEIPSVSIQKISN
ncbi:hypothetical protein ACAG39_10660 [Caldicellulosiruptoraceae bacterium PP1]